MKSTGKVARPVVLDTCLNANRFYKKIIKKKTSLVDFYSGSGRLFHGYFSVLDAAGASCSWPHAAWSHGRDQVLPVARSDPPH